MHCIELCGVNKRFGATDALIDVELRIPEGAIGAIVGESGSGKSTLLQHVNGMLRPDTGRVSVFGAPLDYAALPSLRRRIGYAVQGVGLFPHLDVAHNISLLARLADWPAARIAARVRELLRLVGLDDQLAARFPHQLSGGQQQRVGMCRAMMLAPPLVLLDEPFSGVDPITRGELHQELLTLHGRSGVSMVIVTHDMHEARRLASFLAVMRRGRLLQAGPIEQVIASPADEYVARLLHGEPAR